MLRPVFDARSFTVFFASGIGDASSFTLDTLDFVADLGTRGVTGVTGCCMAGEKGTAGDLNGVADPAWGPGVDLPPPIGVGCAWLIPRPGGTEGVSMPLGSSGTRVSSSGESLSATNASTEVDASSRGSKSSSRTRIYVSE